MTAVADGRNRANLAELLGKFAPTMVFVALLAIFGMLEPSFLSRYSLGVLAGESSVILVLAIGQTLVILMGGIDLSMAALASLVSVLLALVLPGAGVPGLVAVLLLATLIGAIQGYIHARAQIPSFIVTLAGMGILSGAALVIGQTTIILQGGNEAVSWLSGRIAGVPRSFVFAVALLLALLSALRWFPFGRYIYAIGLGELATLLSGVKVARTKIMVFALSGFCAGVAGMMLVARTQSGNPTIADSLLLPSIAAVVVGGTAITGGIGGLMRTLIGALTIGVLRVGMAVVGLNPAYEPIAYGVLIACAVALTIDRSKTLIVK
jgi:ribose transport system permease protein